MFRSCVFIAGPLRNDTRFSNLCHALRRVGLVDIYYTTPDAQDRTRFQDGFELFPYPPPKGRRLWLLRHSLFTREHEFLADAALASGRKYDLVFADNLPTLHGACRVASRHGARLIYSSREIWVETLTQFFPRSGAWPRSWAYRFLPRLMRLLGRWEERRLWPDVDLLVTPNPSYARYLCGEYGARPEVVVMSCPRLGVHARTNRLKEELGLPAGARVVLYQGMFNPGRHLDLLIESGRLLPNEVVLVFMGWGPFEPEMRRLVAERNLAERVKILPPVSYDQLLSYTASADVGVLLLEAQNLSKHLALANKIFEYMSAGLPLVVSNSPDQAAIVKKTGAGRVIDVSTPEKLAADIGALVADTNGLAEYGRNGRRAFESEYNWEVQEARLLSEIEKLIPSSRLTATK